MEILQFEISKLSLKPEDVLIIKVDNSWFTDDMLEDLSAMLQKIIPDYRFLICPRDTELSILSRG